MPSFSKKKLNDDILWQIFVLNSHPITCSMEHDAGYLLGLEFYKGSLERESSLVTTRRASQVCRQWREIILNSPNIWANTIDLQHLNQEGNQWRDEVLRRTGNAPLTVLGHVGEDSLWADVIPRNIFTIPFFSRLLSDHWERIRSLVIISAGMEVDSQLRIAMNRSTPLLEHCVVSFDLDRGKVLHFPTNAPALSSFSVQGQDISLSVLTRASKIRYLKLNWQRVDVVMSELIGTLAKMPLLETLCLDFGSLVNRQPTTTTENPQIDLPRLKHLTLKCPRGPDLLPYINIPPRCTISMYCGYRDHHRTLAYSNFVQAHFHLWNITHILYEVELVQEDPQEQPYPFYQIVLKDCQQDRIAPQFEYHSISEELVTALSMAAALSSCQLHRVISFNLRLNLVEDTLNDPSFNAMYNLLRKLEFIENLHTDKRTLELLRVAELRAGNLVFPKLLTIIVNEWDVSLDKFLDLRREGRLISRVVLSEGSTASVGDPTVLEKASSFGITVGWKIEGITGVREFPTRSATGTSRRLQSV